MHIKFRRSFCPRDEGFNAGLDNKVKSLWTTEAEGIVFHINEQLTENVRKISLTDRFRQILNRWINTDWQ